MLQEPRKPARPAVRGASRVADIDDVRLDLEGLGKAFQHILAGNPEGDLHANVPADVQTIVRGMLGTGIERFRNLGDVARALEPLCGSGPAAGAEIPMATAVNPPPPPEPPPAPPAPVAAEPTAPAATPETPAATPEVPASFFGESPEAEAIAASLRDAEDAIPTGQIPASESVTEAAPAEAAPAATPADTGWPGSPFESAGVGEQEETPFLREKPRRYGTGFWVWAIIGLLLHLIAVGILVYVVISWSGEEKRGTPKGRGALSSMMARPV
jgi:hypothetical protein